MIKIDLFHGIDEREIKLFYARVQAYNETYKKNDMILQTGSSVNHIYILLEGRAMIVHDDIWGNRNIIRQITPGDSFAESFACSGECMSVSVIALQDCNVCKISYPLLYKYAFLHDDLCSTVLSNLYTEIASKNVFLAQKVQHLGQRNTRSKIVSYLSDVALEKNSCEFDIPFNRQQLADYLCVDRSGLCVELSLMQKEGLIEYHKHHFILHNKE